MTHTISSLPDLYATDRLTGLHAERSGTVVATVQSLDDEGARWQPSLHLLAAPGAEAPNLPQRLTEPASRAGLKAIGPDGTCYLTLERENPGEATESQDTLWALPPRGEARPVLTRAGGIEELFARRNRLVFTAQRLAPQEGEERHEELMEARRKQKVSGILYESFPVRSWDADLGPGETALYVADAPDYSPRRIRLPEGVLVEVSVSEDGTRAAVGMMTNRRGIHTRTGTWLIDLDHSADPRPLRLPGAEDAEQAVESLSWYPGRFSPDGTRVLLSSSTASLPGQALRVDLHVLDLEDKDAALTPVAPKIDRWIGDAVWVDDQTLAFATDDLGRGAVWTTQVGQPDAQRITDGDFHYSHLEAAGPGRLVALRDAVDRSAEAVTLDLPAPGTGKGAQGKGAQGRAKAAGPADVEPLPRPAPILHGGGRLTEVTARAEDGTELRAWLALPAAAAGEAPHPLLTFIHGGPWGSWNSWTYRWNPWPFTAAGYAVLMPDPALSTGYGQKMVDRGTDALGGVPYTDLLSLIDAAEALPEIDQTRTAALGGSYGGYMANWMAGHTGDRFRCIVTHASLWDTDVMCRTTDNGVWQEWLMDRPGSQGQENNPSAHLQQIQVPMLVIHGDKDYRVPVSQGHLLWTDLLRHRPALGHRFLYFPDENHWILKPRNSRLWYETVLAFVDRHVRGREWNRPELLG